MAGLYQDADYAADGYTYDAIFVDWGKSEVFVPKVAMTIVQTTPSFIYELNVNTFRLAIRSLEDNVEGMPYLKAVDYVAPKTVGGVELARVVELLPPYTLTFEDGQYGVNLIGGNSNLADRLNLNQVSVRAANSAGLVQTSEIEYSSYQGGVTLDQENGVTGQAYPIGTKESPVNNLEDAKFIAETRGFDLIYIRGNFTFAASDNLNDYEVIGQSPIKTTITLTGAASITNNVFRNARIQGELDGGNSVYNCHITTLNYIDGALQDCELEAGTVTLSGEKAELIRCWSGVAGAASTPIIDMGSSGTNLLIRDYSGGLKLQNESGSDNISIDMASGQLVLDSTISSGTFTIRGVGKLVDNSTGTAVVKNEMLNPGTISDQNWTEATADHQSDGSFGESLKKAEIAARNAFAISAAG